MHAKQDAEASEFSDTLKTGRGREPDQGRELFVGEPTVTLKRGENVKVNSIQ